MRYAYTYLAFAHFFAQLFIGVLATVDGDRFHPLIGVFMLAVGSWLTWCAAKELQ